MPRPGKYKYEVKGDAWYDWKGVKPPERQPHMTEEELDEALAKNISGHICHWHQNGSEIFCDAGEIEHGKRIGPHQMLRGTDKTGQPILDGFGPILRSDSKSA